MKFFRSCLDWLWTSDRRAAKRHTMPSLAAYYWNGGNSKAHTVRDISLTGLFLVTEERWYPRTLVRVTLQKTDGADDDTQRSITVESMVVRWGSDGVGLELLPPDSPNSNRDLTPNSADKKALERFLKEVSLNKVEAIVERVLLVP
ncbi:MAG: PilZ domain-containing protein [Silvibacterium sp.]